jgi:alkylation response protein AidB-like acyl-CoA dehydrogenase
VDFALTEDQELLRESLRALLARECPPSLLRAHIDDLSAADPLWEHLRGFGAVGTGSMVDLCLVMEELGYVAAPARFFASAVLAAPVLSAVGAPLLDAVLAGEQSATVGIAGPSGDWTLGDDDFKSFVPDAASVDVVLAVVGSGAVIQLSAPEMRRLETMDTTRPLYDVRTDGAAAVLGQLSPADFERVIARATVALAAEQVGTARRLFGMALAYAKDRVQFDVPIGSFQAIQHKLAEMSLEVERSWSAVYYAAMTVDAAEPEHVRAVHAAKAAAGSAAKRCAKDGIQIHGGIGYTWEHDLHLFMRRAFGTETLMGTVGWHHDRIGDLLFDGP